MNLDRRSSDRITALRFPLIVLIVFIHAYGIGHYRSDAVQSMNDLSVSDLTQYFISRGFAAVAVPLFYLTSGYLFFLKTDLGGVFFRAKLLSRVRTLLIPFLFWNVATLLAILIFQELPQAGRLFSGGPYSIGPFDLQHYSTAVLGIGRMPISYQTWFIRDLMVLVLLSPQGNCITVSICNRPIPWLIQAITAMRASGQRAAPGSRDSRRLACA